MGRLESQMIAPLRHLMLQEMGLDVTAQEVSAGYGIADLVGISICESGRREREHLSLSNALDHFYLLAVLCALHVHGRTSLDYLLRKVGISERTLNTRILPRLAKLGIVERYQDGYVRLIVDLPNPVQRIVSIEAKQTRWREAITQARRYTFFSDQTYIAVWSDTSHLVSKSLLYRHRLGLISVTSESAEIVIEAPYRKPRKPEMYRYCSELLYDSFLNQRDNQVTVSRSQL